MNVLVINCGSSSLKYQLIDMRDERVIAKGLCERIGIEGSRIKHTAADKDAVIINGYMPDHKAAIKFVIDALVSPETGVIKSVDEITAVGHRVVHGGENFSSSTIIDATVMNAIRDCIDLAPLHNPANIVGIEACQALMPGTPQVAVFDTAFHQTMPEKAYLYAVPYEYYRKYKLRKYGFHGTSHKYVSLRTAEFLGKKVEDLKLVICHLGNGASVCAIDGGKSIDTTMGLTPLEGLAMGTRSGDLDPAIVQFIADKEHLTLKQVIEVLNKQSGVLGVSEISSDFRDLEDACDAGNERAMVTMDLFAYRVAKYVGAYAAAMNGIDAVVFTAGLGENSGVVREDVCKYLNFLGVKVDKDKNKCRGIEQDFSAEWAHCKSLVIPTNEELMIARDTKDLVDNL
ncbi:acetate/propionate family kinase [Anaerotalea alkaliphila]|uniref:Acetate kinase n=1 Tax=Anaerotalea alkaliphila TaxID=2662126 RepID=A0A7X5KMM3_9FIRM|nr:acetate kinase [Anaerotalea alkaliphila]NDL66873.1 acetate kinase [Anaerotalea alkaliphila]